MLNKIELKTNLSIDREIELVVLQEGNVDELFSLVEANRSYLRSFLPWLDLTKAAEDTRFFILRNLKEIKERQSQTFGIRYKNNLVGVTGFNKIDWSNRNAYIGYWLSEDMQGQGIMTRSVDRIVNYAFHDLNFYRLVIRCAVENSASEAIANRLGFQFEGVHRSAEWLYDKFVDHKCFSLLKTDLRS